MMRRRLFGIAVVVIAAVSLVACKGGGSPPAPATISGSNTNPSILSAVATVHQVYAANPSGNVTSAPLATIGGGSTGISAPIGVAVH
jgi:hypothetical protein